LTFIRVSESSHDSRAHRFGDVQLSTRRVRISDRLIACRGSTRRAKDGLLVGYGVSFHTDDIAADVGFLKPIATKGDDGDFLVGLPFVNVSYRWQ
jgi:hypothetical protein